MMQNQKLTLPQSYSVGFYFLESLWNQGKNTFSIEGNDALVDFLSYFLGDPAAEGDWEDSAIKVLENSSITNQTKFNSKEVFMVLIELCHVFYFKFNFNFPQLIDLFDSMLKNPSSYPEYWALWEECIEKSLRGELKKYEYYCP